MYSLEQVKIECSYTNLIPDKDIMMWVPLRLPNNVGVQSIVSLTISLRHKFVKQISAKVTNTLLFFVEKM